MGWSGGLTGPVPRDLWILLGTVLTTFSLGFFATTAVVPALLRLTPAVWQRGFLWQLVTYPFVGTGAPGFWFLVELLVIFLFGKTVLERLGRKNFWRLFLWAGGLAGVAAVLVHVVMTLLGWNPAVVPVFSLMQGQRTLLTILVAAFATLHAEATILLFFVLPIRARWFIPLEVLFAFLGFLGSKDLPGFVGLCAAVVLTVLLLTPGGAAGRKRMIRKEWLRLRSYWYKLRLGWLRRRRGIRVVKDDPKAGRGPWLH